MANGAYEVKYKNRLLALLPTPVIKEMTPHLKRVQLPRNYTLLDAGRPIENVYFLEDGICSIVAVVEDGDSVEVGMTGLEGFVGISIVLGSVQSPNRAFMQIPGYGYYLPARTLMKLVEAHPVLRSSLLRSVQMHLVQTAQTAACNRVHELHERLARWLLLCRDRVQGNRIPITQEFLANMLGTRRSSVTVAAGVLQKAGIIHCTRGNVTILDYEGLLDAACGCYKVVHNEGVRIGLLE